VGAGRPEVLHRVGPPRLPGPGGPDQRGRGRRQPERHGCGPDAEIGRHERVPVAERPHRHGLDRPRADPRQGQQRAPGLLDVAPRGQVERAAGQGPDQPQHRLPPGVGQGQHRRVDLGQPVRGREQVGQPAVRVLDRVAARLDQAAGVGARRGRRHLLAQDRADGELVRMRRPGDAPSRGGVQQRRQHRVGGKDRADRGRVGVQVEQGPAPGHSGRLVRRVGEPEPGTDHPGSGVRNRQRDHAGAARQPQRAPVRAVAPLLHPRDRRRHQVAEQVVREQRFAERQRDLDRREQHDVTPTRWPAQSQWSGGVTVSKWTPLSSPRSRWA